MYHNLVVLFVQNEKVELKLQEVSSRKTKWKNNEERLQPKQIVEQLIHLNLHKWRVLKNMRGMGFISEQNFNGDIQP